MRHGLLQGRDREPPQRGDSVEHLVGPPRLVGVDSQVDPRAQDLPEPPEPADVVLSFNANLCFHIMKMINPIPDGGAKLVEPGLGRDGRAVANVRLCRVPAEAGNLNDLDARPTGSPKAWP